MKLDAWCLVLIVLNTALLLGLLLGWNKLLAANRDLIAAQTHHQTATVLQEQKEHAQGLSAALEDITLTVRGADERP